MKELAAFSAVLPIELTSKKLCFVFDFLVEVNGHRPKDLREFVDILDKAKGAAVFRTGSGVVLMVDAKAARKAQARIMQVYRIPGDRSQDLATT